MSLIPRTDFHMHSNISDGTDSPEKLLELVREEGLEIFSVTDHDTLEGSKIMRSLIKPGDPKFVNGIELSCQDEEGRYHILGYGYDPSAPAINDAVELAHSFRESKARLRVDYVVNELGIKLPQEEIDAFLALENPGKPQLANILVKYGYAQSKKQAIEEILNKFKYPSRYIRPEQAIEALNRSGGIPVLAHPVFGSGDQTVLGDDLEKRVRRLTGFGLKGLEAFYSEFSSEHRDMVLEIAGRFDLYVTAGSDYHGRNKTVKLGRNGLDQISSMPKGLKDFIDKVS